MLSKVTVAVTGDATDPTDSVAFRRTMAEFASGVTVVTALQGGGPVGFACQSFASVSLDPPLVLFCADRRGKSWQCIRAAGRFCVNVLAEDQGELCRRFGSSRGEKFRGLEWEPSAWGTPALPGVLARIHADIHHVYEAGDHDVVVGRALALERPRDGRPMVFFRGHFGIDADEFDADAVSSWQDGWI
ncbi:flavin reductase family protein [Streptomyces sp. NPDC002787]